MGRIDEALRRAARPLRGQDVNRSSAGLFVSPWSVTDADFTAERRAAVAMPTAPRQALPHRAEVRTPVELFASGWRERLAIGANGDPLLADQFRRLAATLLHVQRSDKLRTVMIASALAADGKTTTAINLSLVLSESYRRRVLLVEGDLRRPAITRVTGVPTEGGLSEALKARDERRPSLIQLTETLTLLPAGEPDSEPLSALTSPRLQALLQDASEKFDWVIVDTPPLALTTDATLLCPLVDGVVLVVRAGRTPLDTITHAIDALGRDRILGIVLNASPDAAATGYGHYYSEPAAVVPSSLNLAASPHDL